MSMHFIIIYKTELEAFWQQISRHDDDYDNLNCTILWKRVQNIISFGSVT